MWKKLIWNKSDGEISSLKWDFKVNNFHIYFLTIKEKNDITEKTVT